MTFKVIKGGRTDEPPTGPLMPSETPHPVIEAVAAALYHEEDLPDYCDWPELRDRSATDNGPAYTIRHYRSMARAALVAMRPSRPVADLNAYLDEVLK